MRWKCIELDNKFEDIFEIKFVENIKQGNLGIVASICLEEIGFILLLVKAIGVFKKKII